ncbi:uncharacterized protein LOC128241851 [Mya arenaria]|uniref:uncharacterized protein LOC128241851 n=1 Tax=Mya arenaria TaxID=6604 RepID=UPI0022E5EAC4|nr:uncharacterized protein LOC128241851 [Mya arenaria]
MVQKQYRQAQKCIYWKQPTGSLKVEVSQEQRFPIGISFTFMDGLQTRYQPFPGQPYKGSTFEGRLKNDSEGVTVCGMLKTAFKRGQMFTIGKDGSVGLDGISMFDSPLLAKVSRSRYVKYIEKVKAEMKAKGITEANIDETEKLEETFSVAGP